MVVINEEDYLAHYGILRRSGRYPWGSGGPENVSSNPDKRNKEFLDYVDHLKREGLSEVEIARGMGISTTQLRAAKSIAKTEQKQAQILMAQRLKDKGYSNVAIGERMGLNESSVRALLAPGQKDKTDQLEGISNMLKREVADKKYVDIGVGVENHVGVSNTRLKTAVAMLQEEGYTVHYVKVQQLGTGFDTYLKILAAPGTTYSEVAANKANIRQITERSDDGGRSSYGLYPPLSVSSRRVGVVYGDEGGAQADGVIYVRPGAKDLSLGKARYAQVRILVDNTHYLKGMAMYKDDLPEGVDLLFNTNKKNTGNKKDALKKISDDPDNPFGAMVDQLKEERPDGTVRVTSAMNIVNEEGDWGRWSKNISSQMLSKQSPALAKSQLDMTYERRLREYEEISKLTNPAVKKKLLESFADSTDTAAVQLKAAALPRQASHVILPIPSLPPTQIYAPNYRDGEQVVLIRYPHGGTFEIPELTVNNNHRPSKKILGDAKDAVGIHPSVAERLSGADFDGDTVLVIPNGGPKRVKTTPALEGLKNFDPQMYKLPDDSPIPRMTAREKQTQMGVVSNLITDMTIQKASTSEIARAVRHSMVVIDAEKHHLNYKQSAIDNGIPQLKEKYQGGARRGASTLISRASSEMRVPERKPRSAGKGGPIDPVTGKKVYEETGRVNYKTGALKTTKTTKLAEADDAHVLSSGTPIERVYADHSNRLKSLANQARKDALSTPSMKYSPSAKEAYSKEVTTLNAKLAIALRNAPLERQAQVVANTIVSAKRAATPDMEPATLKKVKAQALNEARLRTGAKKTQIVITQSEWDAIQAGAISNSKLTQILTNADLDVVKELATPKTQLLMTPVKTRRAQAMAASGYTRAEIADALGVSLTTLDTALSS